MSDLVSIEMRRTPWEPTADTQLAEVYDYYDMPLSGHLRQAGSDFVFWRVDYARPDMSIWAYAAVTPEELSAIEETHDPDGFDAAFARAVAGKPLMAALNLDSVGILFVVPIERPAAYQSVAFAVHDALVTAGEQLERFGVITGEAAFPLRGPEQAAG